jgi:hypothetical protein
MNLEEKKAALADVIKNAKALLSYVEYASTCDNETDFKVNVEAAIDEATDSVRVLNQLLSEPIVKVQS